MNTVDPPWPMAAGPVWALVRGFEVAIGKQFFAGSAQRELHRPDVGSSIPTNAAIVIAHSSLLREREMLLMFSAMLRWLVACFALCVAGGDAFAANAKPNVVVILTDDHDDTDVLSLMPQMRLHIANKGVRFTNSFVDFPLCSPSRASFLTGLAAHNHGITSNKTPGGYAAFASHESDALPVWLQSAGYRTALIGKYINGYNAIDPTHVPPGWSEWYALATAQPYYRYSLNQNGKLVRYDATPGNYSTDRFARLAVNFIARAASSPEPFFLLVATTAPHSVGEFGPPVPPDRYIGAQANLPLEQKYRTSFNEADVSDKPSYIQSRPRLDRAGIDHWQGYFRTQRETMMGVDDLVGKIANALSGNAKLRNTVVIFVSDNGFSYGNHRVTGKGTAFEESVRVPLFIKGPNIPQGQTRDQLVSNLDWVATILAITGATASHPIDGRSLMPIIADPSAAWRSAMLLQGSGVSGTFMTSDPTMDEGTFFAVRNRTEIYSESLSNIGIEYEYYDLAADRYELNNKAADPAFATRVSDLHALLSTLKGCSGDTCWVP